MIDFIEENSPSWINRFFFKAGVNPNATDKEQRTDSYLNIFAFYVMTLLIALGLLIVVLGFLEVGLVAAGYSLIPFSVFLLRRLHFKKTALFYFIYATPIYLLVADYYSVIIFLDTGIDNQHGYFFKHFGSAVSIGSALTMMMSNIKAKYIFLNITIQLAFWGFYEEMLIYFGLPEGWMNKLDRGFLTLDYLLMAGNTLSLIGQVVFMRLVNLHFEKQVDNKKAEIEEKNSAINTQNEELMQQQEELTMQRDFITQSNQELTHKNNLIQDSIFAAEVIQKAVFPTATKLTKLLKNFSEQMVIFKPKDIVSGDFYWIKESGESLWLVVGDCTGHGVPGAFMTLLANQLLDRVIHFQQVDNPAQALEALDKELRIALQQQETNNQNGMDLVLLKLIYNQNGQLQIQFSGAKNSLYIHYPNTTSLERIKGDRISLGGVRKSNKTFSTQEFTFPKGTQLYMTTDGIQDQNNPANKSLNRNGLENLILENASFSMANQKENIIKAIAKHQQHMPQRDDMLLIGLKI